MRLKVNPCDGLGWNRVGCAGEWGIGTIVKIVEAADAMVEVVMGEELGKIRGLVFHCQTHLLLYCVIF